MYKKLILGTALGLVIFASNSLAIDCNLTYKLQGDSYTVTGASNKSDCTTANIPSTYEGKSVTSIGDEAFYGTQLTSVTIPDGVTSIGVLAFYGIPTLTSAEIQGNNVTIDSRSFSATPAQVQHTGNITWSCGNDCTATLDKDGHAEFTGTGALTTGIVQGFKEGITNVIISDGITSIGSDTFYGSTLESVIIPDSVTSIGDEAFYGTQLTSVTIPDGVTSIGVLAFYGIPTLTSLVLPDSVTSVGGAAFSATALKEIFCSSSSVESGKCASMASAGGANVSKINFGYYEDDAMSEERIFYLKDENGVWKEARRESIYEKYVSDTGAVYLYDSKGNLKKMRGKKIYTVEEAVEATKNGNSFHVGLTYK